MVSKTRLCASLTISLRSIAAYGYGIIRTQIRYFFQDFPAIAIGQINIRDENVTVRRWNFLECFHFATGRKNDVSLLLEINLNGRQGVIIILNDEYAQRKKIKPVSSHTR
jgi:hypothetical protein